MRRLSALLAIVPALVLGGHALSQALPIEVEVGYRYADISGNEDMYRSQVNERSGFLLRSLSLVDDYSGRSGAYDRLRLDASDLGAGPSGAARFDLSKGGVYALHLSYRRADLFSALPAFANPFLAQGVVPGQHTYDRTRHVFDAELELLPGKAIRPLLGYSLNRASGPGTTTYTVGGDDFLLTQHLTDQEQEFRVGAAFDVGPVSGVVTQGWRKATETEALTLAPGAGGGNSSGTVLGTPVSLTNYQSSSTSDTNTPVTNAVVTARLGSRVRVLGSYVRARSQGDTAEAEALTGSLVSFPLRSTFTGSNETVSSRTRDPFWSASGRVEVSFTKDVDLSVGLSASEHELEGMALVTTLFLGALPFGGVTAADVQELLSASTAVDRKDAVYFARVHARSFGPFAFTAGLSQTDQHVTVTADPSEIVVPGNQGGSFSRQIRSYELGATFTQSGFTLGADMLKEKADRPIVRTDFLSRSRYRVRAGWKGSSWLTLTANAQRTDSDDDWPGIAYGSRWQQYGFEAGVTPAKGLHARVGVGVFEVDSNILFRQPQDFSTAVSNLAESGRYKDLGLSLTLSAFSADVSYQRFDNKGTLHFSIDRIRARVEVPLRAGISLAGEYAKDKYGEAFLPALGNYDADRYGLFVRFAR